MLFHSYKYNTIIQVFQNESMNIAACRKTEVLEIQIEPSVEDNASKTVGETQGGNGLTGTLRCE